MIDQLANEVLEGKETLRSKTFKIETLENQIVAKTRVEQLLLNQLDEKQSRVTELSQTLFQFDQDRFDSSNPYREEIKADS